MNEAARDRREICGTFRRLHVDPEELLVVRANRDHEPGVRLELLEERGRGTAGRGRDGGAGGAAVHAQLVVDVLDVALDRTCADDKLGGDLGVAHAGGEEAQDFGNLWRGWTSLGMYYLPQSEIDSLDQMFYGSGCKVDPESIVAVDGWIPTVATGARTTLIVALSTARPPVAMTRAFPLLRPSTTPDTPTVAVVASRVDQVIATVLSTISSRSKVIAGRDTPPR